jgi:MarR family transcriptional regulator, lower aerobic nicotinate degradation pathway regulator
MRLLIGSRQEERREPTIAPENGYPGEVAILITRLQRYLALYIKPAIKDLGFTKEHEYNFLYQVGKMRKPNKNDLSKENMVEFSTGRDIIRRLIAKNLIVEKTDPDDKRATLLILTSRGRKTLDKSFEMIAGSFTDFLGDLTTREQIHLITLLTKLNNYQALKNKKEILSYL